MGTKEGEFSGGEELGEKGGNIMEERKGWKSVEERGCARCWRRVGLGSRDRVLRSTEYEIRRTKRNTVEEGDGKNGGLVVYLPAASLNHVYQRDGWGTLRRVME